MSYGNVNFIFYLFFNQLFFYCVRACVCQVFIKRTCVRVCLFLPLSEGTFAAGSGEQLNAPFTVHDNKQSPQCLCRRIRRRKQIWRLMGSDITGKPPTHLKF